jgi:EmrB/QacA subfamily drug resistance transporter
MSTIVNPPCDIAQISAPPAGPVSSPRGAWILAATILGSSMAFIDGTVVNVALPVIQLQFRATSAQVQWVVESYALFLAALLLLGGVLGDRWGRRRVFSAGVAIFALSSVACGLAPNITLLTIFRAVQGIGGALLTPASLAIISASFDSEHRGKAIGTWSGFTAITAALGPVLGGWLVEYVSWRAVFFINIPMALIVLWIAARHLPESHGDASERTIDWWGALLVTAGLGAITYGLLSWSGSGGQRLLVAATLVGGVILLGAFLLVESRVRLPLVPLGLFRSRNFSGSNVLTLLLYAALGGTLYFVPFNLIQVQSYSPTGAGLSLLPFILIMFVLSRWSGGLVARYGAKPPLVLGPLVAAGGFALFARPGVGGSYWTTFFPAVIVLGLGMAVAVAPLTTTVMSAVSGEHSGLASGVNNAVSRTAGLLAVALMGILMLAAFSSELHDRLISLKLEPEAVRQIDAGSGSLAGLTIPAGLDQGSQAAVRQAVADSFVTGFRVVMIVAAVLALASAISAGVLITGGKAT